MRERETEGASESRCLHHEHSSSYAEVVSLFLHLFLAPPLTKQTILHSHNFFHDSLVNPAAVEKAL